MRSLLLLFLVGMVLSCSTNSEYSNDLVGNWQDQRFPDRSWKIEKTTFGYKGTRTGAADGFKLATENWKLKDEGKLLKLIPQSTDGTTLTYIKQSKNIIRHPPGSIYIKIK